MVGSLGCVDCNLAGLLLTLPARLAPQQPPQQQPRHQQVPGYHQEKREGLSCC